MAVLSRGNQGLHYLFQGQAWYLSIFAIRIGVVNEQPQAAICAGPGVLDYLHVGIGIAKGQDRAHTNVFIDTRRLDPTAGAALAAPAVLS
jgi:hypothetical protein